MKYLSVDEARALPGLRLALVAGMPSPWSESAKAMFRLRNVDFAPIAQMMFAPNDELVAWTGHRNAPVAVLDDEPPHNTWFDMVMLAERLGSGPSLVPEASADRTLAMGISAEICSPGGFGWTRRILMTAKAPPEMAEASKQYGYSENAVSVASARLVDILSNLTSQIVRQRAAGSDYLVGNRLSMCDIHWACFSIFVDPLPLSDVPMPPPMREHFADVDPIVAAAVHPELIAHRDRIFKQYIGLPLDF